MRPAALQVMQKTVQACLNLLQAHRAHEAVDAALLRSVLRMLRDLGVYTTRFHEPCLAGADAAYTAQGQELAGGDLPVASALAQAEVRLQEEEVRTREFLDIATLEPMLAVVKRRLLEEHLKAYISRGLGDLLEQRRHDDLARMYRLACAPTLLRCTCSFHSDVLLADSRAKPMRFHRNTFQGYSPDRHLE